MSQPVRLENKEPAPKEAIRLVTPAQPRNGSGWISEWNPENAEFWESTGKKIAQRNLWISVAALMLAFVVWMVWSTVVVELPNVGFKFSTDQLFWLAALPGLSGATLRIFYAFMVPVFGGRNWTVITTAMLLLPMIGLGYAVQDPGTSFGVFLTLALLCGLGGGNFASSMSNISFFYPKATKGTALGLNGGLGNLGVSVVQFFMPLVIGLSVYGSWGGTPQTWTKATVTKQVWLQNAAWVWVPLIAIVTLAAWRWMNNLTAATASFKDQSVVFKRKHTWLASALYTGTFGSFIGYSAALPLLIKTEFPAISPLRYAFIGPLLGAVARTLGGWIADRVGGGAKVTLIAFGTMVVSAIGVLYFLDHKEVTGAFIGFLLSFILLFFMSGIGNGTIYRMVPSVFTKLFPENAVKESAAVLGFISAISAYGAFIIPKSFGFSMEKTGSVYAAFMGLITYYLICLSITWWFYARKNAEVPC